MKPHEFSASSAGSAVERFLAGSHCLVSVVILHHHGRDGTDPARVTNETSVGTPSWFRKERARIPTGRSVREALYAAIQFDAMSRRCREIDLTAAHQLWEKLLQFRP